MEQITKNSEIVELTENELIETNGGISVILSALQVVAVAAKNKPPKKPIPKD